MLVISFVIFVRGLRKDHRRSVASPSVRPNSSLYLTLYLTCNNLGHCADENCNISHRIQFCKLCNFGNSYINAKWLLLMSGNMVSKIKRKIMGSFVFTDIPKENWLCINWRLHPSLEPLFGLIFSGLIPHSIRHIRPRQKSKPGYCPICFKCTISAYRASFFDMKCKVQVGNINYILVTLITSDVGQQYCWFENGVHLECNKLPSSRLIQSLK